MDPVLALTALAFLVLGLVCAMAAALCRVGRARVARFWVRPGENERRTGYAYGEIAALVVLPLIAQTLIVSGVVIGVISVDVLRASAAGVLVPAVVVAEVILWVVLMAATGYRSIMPLWVYPSWLRPERRREKDLLRAR